MDTIIAFGRTDTGLVLGDLTIDFCLAVSDGSAVSTVGTTLTELGAGMYTMSNPNVTEDTIVSVYVTAAPTKICESLFEMEDPTAADIADEICGSAARTLNLKAVNVVNNAGTAVNIQSTDATGIRVEGATVGLEVYGQSHGAVVQALAEAGVGLAVQALAADGVGVEILAAQQGVSITNSDPLAIQPAGILVSSTGGPAIKVRPASGVPGVDVEADGAQAVKLVSTGDGYDAVEIAQMGTGGVGVYVQSAASVGVRVVGGTDGVHITGAAGDGVGIVGSADGLNITGTTGDGLVANGTSGRGAVFSGLSRGIEATATEVASSGIYASGDGAGIKGYASGENGTGVMAQADGAASAGLRAEGTDAGIMALGAIGNGINAEGQDGHGIRAYSSTDNALHLHASVGAGLAAFGALKDIQLGGTGTVGGNFLSDAEAQQALIQAAATGSFHDAILGNLDPATPVVSVSGHEGLGATEIVVKCVRDYNILGSEDIVTVGTLLASGFTLDPGWAGTDDQYYLVLVVDGAIPAGTRITLTLKVATGDEFPLVLYFPTAQSNTVFPTSTVGKFVRWGYVRGAVSQVPEVPYLLPAAVRDVDNSTPAAGSLGEAVNNASGGGGTPEEIADAVWEEAYADHSGVVGSAAEKLAALSDVAAPTLTDIGTLIDSKGLAKESTLLGNLTVVRGVLVQRLVASEEVVITRGDVTVLEFNLGSDWSLTGKKVYLTVKRSLTDTTAVFSAECTITDADNGIAQYTTTPTDFTNIGRYHFDLEIQTTDPQNPLPRTAMIGVLVVRPDVRRT